MTFEITYPDHSHIGGKISFEIIELDPYNNFKPTGKKQLYQEHIPVYHLDSGDRLGLDRNDSFAFHKFILKRMQERFREMLLALEKQISANKFVSMEVSNNKGIQNYEVTEMPSWFTIE